MENDVENVLPAGDPGQPAPAPSAGPGQRPSVDPDAIAAAFGDPAVLKILDDLVARRVQSEKDRRFHKLESKVGDIESLLDQYDALRSEGLSKTRAVREIRTAQLLTQLEGQQSAEPPQPAGRAPEQPAAIEADENLLSVLGISANDPEWAALMRLGHGTQEQAIELAKRRQSRQPAPNPAGVMPVSGGQPEPAGDTIEDIDRQIAALKAKPVYQVSKADFDALLARRRKLLDQQLNR